VAEMSCTNIYDRCKAKYEGLTTSPLTLATDLTRRLVLAQTHVNRVSQEVVGRPSQIRDLHDELRLDPMDPGKNER